MSATEASFSTVDGVPLYYWRAGSKQRTTVRGTYAFQRKLDNFVKDLRTFTEPSYGRLVSVATAGLYVNKPGAHGRGRAFDLDDVTWSRLSATPYARQHASGDRAVRRRYVALDAVCRRQFKYVLDGWYNAAHADHLHLDDSGGGRTLNKSFRSDVVFVQAVCNQLTGTTLAVDGEYGPMTDRAYREAKRRSGVTGDTSSDVGAWLAFLAAVARAGFADRTL